MKKDKDLRYRVEASMEALHNKLFKTKRGADRYLEKMEAKLKEANKLADGSIWTNIEIIYLTRWDCCTAQLATAQF